MAEIGKPVREIEAPRPVTEPITAPSPVPVKVPA